jgi:uncharacterized protein DUF4387
VRTVRIITPTGHLGTTPLEKASFERGCAVAPDFIVADSGSADIGPYPLGADRRLLGVEESRVTDFVVFEPAHAIKFTIRRMRPSGSMGESDLFGSQQYAPLFDIDIP